jgi:lipoprotein-releasing system permease protein
MTEILQPILGFVSATLVALVALAFGALFLFFTVSAMYVLGQFLRFARPARVALPALLGGTLLVGGLSFSLGAADAAVWPAAQLVYGLVAYALVRWRRWRLAILSLVGLLLVGTGIAFVLAFVFPSFAPAADVARQLSIWVLLAGALGTWPLVLAGLVEHRRQRPVEWFISLRYLVAKRRQTFISVITVICVLGVALGVAVITVVLSVMNGFSQVWEGKIIGARAHFVLHSRLGYYGSYDQVREEVIKLPGVEGATPFLQTDAILRGQSGAIQAVVLKGVDPETVAEATQLEADLVAGSLADLEPDPEAEGTLRLPGVIFGAELADRFLLRVGDPVILISPLGGPPTPLGPAPRMERFRMAGIFRSNFFQFDESFVYTSLPAAQRFMKLDDVVTGIEVRTVDAYRSQAIADTVVAHQGGLFYARDWKTFYPGFFSALKTERVMMFVLLSFIMVVAGFIIISTLIMMIMEKSRDIAILKAMGCDDDGVLRVFATQGFLIGVAGVGFGLAMGLVITLNLARIQAVVERIVGYDVLPANVYQLQQLPYHIIPMELAGIALIAMVLSIGATLLPCWQAARLDPAEALRYE